MLTSILSQEEEDARKLKKELDDRLKSEEKARREEEQKVRELEEKQARALLPAAEVRPTLRHIRAIRLLISHGRDPCSLSRRRLRRRRLRRTRG